jgi:hypothetical protein
MPISAPRLAALDEPARARPLSTGYFDRYFTPDYVQTTDGDELDRDHFVAHIETLRRAVVDGHIEVMEATQEGDHFAERHIQ